jgi:hypothetical protein
VNNESTKNLEEDIVKQLEIIADKYSISIDGSSITSKFSDLISSLAKATNKRVVLLFDEYDNPITERMESKEEAEKNRMVLQDFYKVIKGQDANIQFCLLTGVSKYSRMSLFSKLNNLIDITLDEKFANICGITENDFDELFTGEYEGIEREEIFDWYDGYSWDGKTRVFNPFSLLSFFRDKAFDYHWYKTGIPRFLIDDIKKRPEEYLRIQEATITERLLDSYDIEKAPIVSVLFQTGFLTIKEKLAGRPPWYKLSFPNIEVASAFSSDFISGFISDETYFNNSFREQILTSISNGDISNIKEPMETMLASFSYHQYKNVNESMYHILFAFLLLLSLQKLFLLFQ